MKTVSAIPDDQGSNIQQVSDLMKGGELKGWEEQVDVRSQCNAGRPASRSEASGAGMT